MSSYRIRTPFRVLSGLIATITLIGDGFLATHVGKNSSLPVPLMLVEVILFVVCVLFAWLAFAGRAPSAVEEYGLDGDDIIEYRNKMRTKDIYKP